MTSITRRLLATLAALMLAVLAAAPAFATDIKDSQVPTDAAGAPQGTTDECKDFQEEGMVQWHFLLNDHDDSVPTGGWGTVTVTAEYDTDGDGIADETLTDSDSDPTDHYIYSFFIVTEDDWVLIDASTDFGSATSDLLLSHVCIGPPPPVVPEAPLAMLLPLVALGGIGVFLFRNRRTARVLS